MKTLHELGAAVIQIREALENLTTRGSDNAAIIIFCTRKCNEVVAAINDAAKTAPPGDVEIDLEIEQKEEEASVDHI